VLQRPHLAVESATHGRGAVTEGLDILIFLSMYSDESFFLERSISGSGSQVGSEGCGWYPVGGGDRLF
jgi:hypothetical protein